MPTIYELDHEVTRLREAYKARYDAFPTKTLADGTEAKDIPADGVKELRDLQAEMEAKGNLLGDMRNAERAAIEAGEALKAGMTPVNRVAVPTEKGFDFKSFLAKAQTKAGAELDMETSIAKLTGYGAKATMTTSAGFAPEVLRSGDIVAAISRPPQLIDFLPTVQTSQNAISYMVQSTRTNAADAKTEVEALAEATLAYTLTTEPIERIGTFLPVSDIQLDDEPMIRSILTNDGVLMVRQELDEQVTVGTGSAPQIRGLYNATNVQTQAKGSDPVFDAVHKAIGLVRIVGRANPNLIVMHYNDWQDVRLTRTVEGVYLLGNPNDAGAQQLWGLPVVLSEALTEGNGMVVDTSFVRLVFRTGVNVAVSDSHASSFISGVQTFRFDVRAGLMKLRGQAICRITGI